MPYSRTLLLAAFVALGGCSLTEKPTGQGPQWVERPPDDLVKELGKPDRVVRLPSPSLSTVYLYTGGAQPGFALCERMYYVRGATVVGYSEHGSDPTCTRHAGNTN